MSMVNCSPTFICVQFQIPLSTPPEIAHNPRKLLEFMFAWQPIQQPSQAHTRLIVYITPSLGHHSSRSTLLISVRESRWADLKLWLSTTSRMTNPNGRSSRVRLPYMV